MTCSEYTGKIINAHAEERWHEQNGIAGSSSN